MTPAHQGEPCLFQVKRVEALREPAVDGREKIAGLLSLILIAPQPRHARRGAQFEGPCLMLTRDRERTFEIRFSFGRIPLVREQRNFPGYTMNFSVAPGLLGRRGRRHRFADASPSVVELA